MLPNQYPDSTQIRHGAGSVGSALNGLAAPLESIAQLKAIAAPQGVANVAGYYAAGDGGGGLFKWDAASTATDNGGTIIRPNHAPVSGRWIKDNKATISVAEFGVIANDPTDQTSKIQAALDAGAGKTVSLHGSSTYIVTIINVPSGTSLLTNNSVFRRVSGSDYIVSVNDGVRIDALTVSDVGGASNKGINIKGSNVAIGVIKAISDIADSQFGVRIEGSSRLSSINIQSILTENYKSAVQCFNIISSSFGRIVMNRIVTGLYLRDVKNTRFDSVYSALTSALATGGAGENGILIESTSAAYGTEGVTFGNVDVKDTGEHGVRIGGLLPTKNVHFDSITTINTGAANGTGGAGFKVLGYESAAGVYQYHEDISVGILNITDVSVTGSGINNFSGVILASVKGAAIGNYTLRKLNNANSAKNGLFISNCQDVSVSNIKIKDVSNTGVLITTDSASPTSELVKNITLSGDVETLSAASSVLYFQTGALTVDGFTFDGKLRKGGVAIRSDSTTGAAYRKGVKLNVVYIDPLNTASGPPIQCNNYPEEIVVDFTGLWYGTFGSGCCNGSIFRDPSGVANAVRIRKSSGWTVL